MNDRKNVKTSEEKYVLGQIVNKVPGEKINVIIDTDPGVDDSAAIALSLYDSVMDIKLITTVAGNKDVNMVTRNCLHLLELFKRTDIPVAKGSGRAMFRVSPDASYIHKTYGLGGYVPPQKTKTQPIKERAVEAMYRVIKENAHDISIIAIGPHTNIAKLITKHPDVIHMISHIYTEGCNSYYETSKSERWNAHRSFNARTDPEAANVVINSGIPITYIPSEIGRDYAYFTEAEVNEIGRLNDVGKYIYAMYSDYWEPGYQDRRVATNDTCAILALRFPDLFEMRPVKISFNTSDAPGLATIRSCKKSNVMFAHGINREKMHAYYYNAIKKMNDFKLKI